MGPNAAESRAELEAQRDYYGAGSSAVAKLMLGRIWEALEVMETAEGGAANGATKPAEWTTIRTTNGAGRITYHSEWDSAKPWGKLYQRHSRTAFRHGDSGAAVFSPDGD